MSETANTSKGAKSFAEWTEYKKENIKVDENFRQTMMDRERELEMALQQQVKDLSKAQKLHTLEAQKICASGFSSRLAKIHMRITKDELLKELLKFRPSGKLILHHDDIPEGIEPPSQWEPKRGG